MPKVPSNIPSFYLDRSNHTGKQPISSINGLQHILKNIQNAGGILGSDNISGQGIGVHYQDNNSYSYFKRLTSDSGYLTLSETNGIITISLDTNFEKDPSIDQLFNHIFDLSTAIVQLDISLNSLFTIVDDISSGILQDQDPSIEDLYTSIDSINEYQTIQDSSILNLFNSNFLTESSVNNSTTLYWLNGNLEAGSTGDASGYSYTATFDGTADVSLNIPYSTHYLTNETSTLIVEVFNDNQQVFPDIYVDRVTTDVLIEWSPGSLSANCRYIITNGLSSGGGGGDSLRTYIDSSLNARDTSINWLALYKADKSYVDASLVNRDNSINYLYNYDIIQDAKFFQVDSSITELRSEITDLSTYIDNNFTRVDASINDINAYQLIQDASIATKQDLIVEGTYVKESSVNDSSTLYWDNGKLEASVGSYAVANYYVDGSLGNDSNDGISAGTGAFLTIQHAFDILETKNISQSVNINVAANIYQESINVPPLNFGGDYRINIIGDTSIIDTGTADSSTKYIYSGYVIPASLIDTDKNWTLGEHQKSFLHLTGGTGYNSTNDISNWYQIRDNSTNSISIVGEWNSGIGIDTTYEIVTLSTIIDGSSLNETNVAFRGDRITFKNFKIIGATGFSIFGYNSNLNILEACYIENSANSSGAAIGVINAGIRAISCYTFSNNINNIAFFVPFSIGNYFEDFLTSSAFIESASGIKGCWVDGGDNFGVQLSLSHTRLTGNYFTNISGLALQIGRQSSSTIYSNDFGGYDVNVIDQSYLKIQSGNVINNLTSRESTVLTQNGGSSFDSIINTENYGYATRIYNNADQDVSSGGSHLLSFNSSRYDNFNIKTDSSLVIPTTGNYLIGLQVTFASNNSGDRRTARIKLNSDYIAIDQVPPVQNNQTLLSVTTQYHCNEGDVLTADVTQDSGSDLTIQSLTNFSPEFWIVKI